MKDRLDDLIFYRKSCELWDLFWNDSEVLLADLRGRRIADQLTRSVGSVGANIEEGYGRGFGKEYPQFLRYSRCSARESKGWYWRARFLLGQEIVKNRIALIDEIIAMLSATIHTLENKKN